MSLTQRLRREGADAFQQKYSLGMFKLCAEAADRIAALEFEVEHERYNVEKTAQEAAKRIKVLEAALKEAGEMWIRKDNRIEALETALREIKQLALSCKPAETPAALAHMVRICIDAGITRAALAPEQEK